MLIFICFDQMCKLSGVALTVKLVHQSCVVMALRPGSSVSATLLHQLLLNRHVGPCRLLKEILVLFKVLGSFEPPRSILRRKRSRLLERHVLLHVFHFCVVKYLIIT